MLKSHCPHQHVSAEAEERWRGASPRRSLSWAPLCVCLTWYERVTLMASAIAGGGVRLQGRGHDAAAKQIVSAHHLRARENSKDVPTDFHTLIKNRTLLFERTWAIVLNIVNYCANMTNDFTSCHFVSF